MPLPRIDFGPHTCTSAGPGYTYDPAFLRQVVFDEVGGVPATVWTPQGIQEARVGTREAMDILKHPPTARHGDRDYRVAHDGEMWTPRGLVLGATVLQSLRFRLHAERARQSPLAESILALRWADGVIARAGLPLYEPDVERPA